MNKEVSYPIAKLLKEKGFDKTDGIYNFYVKPNSKMFGIDEKGRAYSIKNIAKKLYKIGEYATLNDKNVYLAPTIAEVVMWIFETYGIWIAVFICKDFMFDIIIKDTVVHTELNFNSPTEAYEAGIKYCLEKII